MKMIHLPEGQRVGRREEEEQEGGGGEKDAGAYARSKSVDKPTIRPYRGNGTHTLIPRCYHVHTLRYGSRMTRCASWTLIRLVLPLDIHQRSQVVERHLCQQRALVA